MKKVQSYKTMSGSILAELYVDGQGVYWLKSLSGRNLGSYNPRVDCTYEWPSGKIIAHGNTLGMLIPKEPYKS
ncbi:MAG: hypothetical protein J5828_06525 [Desulfovibrionaceae bacterium]|nr:hypothetical protein [Desulfovibrionaceae bacterium]